jgi:hypothetical protein
MVATSTSSKCSRLSPKPVFDISLTGATVTIKTNKTREQLVMEGVIAQLRHAYFNLIRPADRAWDVKQRQIFADGLIAPQIRTLERAINANEFEGRMDVFDDK